MICTPLDLAGRYFNFEAWHVALGFLADLTAGSPEQDELVPLGETGMLTRVMRYETRGPENGVLEAHDRFVDLQMSLQESEAIDCFPRSTLRVKTPYNAERDVVIFHRPGDAPFRVKNHPGILSVYFPEDAHMAQQCAGASPVLVKKVVIKVPLRFFG